MKINIVHISSRIAAIALLLLLFASCRESTSYRASVYNYSSQNIWVDFKTAGGEAQQKEFLPSPPERQSGKVWQNNLDGKQPGMSREEFEDIFDTIDIRFVGENGDTLNLGETGFDLKDINNWRYMEGYDDERYDHWYILDVTDSLLAQ